MKEKPQQAVEDTAAGPALAPGMLRRPHPSLRVSMPDASDPARALRVLFVEDNDYLREVIGMLLEEENVELVACGSAEEAQTELARGSFDLILTDVNLPRLSGTELAKQVLAVRPDAWIVFSSGYVLDHGLSRLGPNVRSLTKPFEVDALQALLAEIRVDVLG